MSLSFVLLMLVLGAITLALRYSFIYFHGKKTLPPQLQACLPFIPVSVLSALVAPALIEGSLPQALIAPRFIAGMIACMVAWYSKSVLVTLVVGMMVLWALKFIS